MSDWHSFFRPPNSFRLPEISSSTESGKSSATLGVNCIAQAVRTGLDPTRRPIIIADVADNPGGGGRGNTTWLLEALHKLSDVQRKTLVLTHLAAIPMEDVVESMSAAV